VRRLFAVFVAGFGLAAWLERRRGRRTASEPELSPADELRARLSETRARSEEPAAPEAPDADPQARRRAVHERARRDLDDLG